MKRDAYAARFRAFTASNADELPKQDPIMAAIAEHTATTDVAIARAAEDFTKLEQDKRGLTRRLIAP